MISETPNNEVVTRVTRQVKLCPAPASKSLVFRMCNTEQTDRISSSLFRELGSFTLGVYQSTLGVLKVCLDSRARWGSRGRKNGRHFVIMKRKFNCANKKIYQSFCASREIKFIQGEEVNGNCRPDWLART